MIDLGWLHILRPWWLLAIPVILLGSWLWHYCIRTMISGVSLIDPALRQVMVTGKGNQSRLSFAATIFSLLLCAFALSGPGWTKIDKPIEKPLQATFIVLDLSFSMAAEDSRPSRYKRAQFKIADFVNAYRDEGPFAMIAYAGDAHLVTPITDDTDTLLNFVDDLYPGILPTAGSLPETALAMVHAIEQDNGLQYSRVLLVTDGVHQQSIQPMTQLVGDYGLQLSILAVGEKSGVPITTDQGSFLRQANGELALADFDLPSLERLASATNSKLTRLTVGKRDLNQLFGDHLNTLNDDTRATDNFEQVAADQGYLVLLVLVPLALLLMRRGLLLSLLLLLIFPDTSWALGWRDIWQSKEYQAQQQLEQQRYQEAEQLSDNPNTVGAALYRQQQYQQAAEAFEQLDNALGRYNAANSYMQLQQFDQAITHYQQALAEVENDDQLQASIEKNLTIARDQVAQQEKQEQQEQQGQQGQSGQARTARTARAVRATGTTRTVRTIRTARATGTTRTIRTERRHRATGAIRTARTRTTSASRATARTRTRTRTQRTITAESTS